MVRRALVGQTILRSQRVWCLDMQLSETDSSMGVPSGLLVRLSALSGLAEGTGKGTIDNLSEVVSLADRLAPCLAWSGTGSAGFVKTKRKS